MLKLLYPMFIDHEWNKYQQTLVCHAGSYYQTSTDASSYWNAIAYEKLFLEQTEIVHAEQYFEVLPTQVFKVMI